MINQKTFGGLLVGIGISIVVVYFVLLFLNETWAVIVAMTILVIIVGIMFFWLGYKVLVNKSIEKESDESEKV